MNESNGNKTRIIFFLLGLLQAIVLWWVNSISAKVSQTMIDRASDKANIENISKQMDGIASDIKEIKSLMLRRR